MQLLHMLSHYFLNLNLIVHDIHSLEYTDVNKAWNEFRCENDFTYKEFVCREYFFVCGVGIAISKS